MTPPSCEFRRKERVRIEPARELWGCLQRVRWLRVVARSGSPTGWNGIGIGSVVVEAPSATVLTYAETGSWQPVVGSETRFRGSFRWGLVGPELIRLEHLRLGEDHPVYLFDLAPVIANSWCSVAPHLCSEDRYSAGLQMRERGLLLRWVIAGPRKRDRIEYEYLTMTPVALLRPSPCLG